MSIVQLHVYDVTSTASENTNAAIQRLNDVGRAIGSGGVFHGGVEVNGVEWSYGFCEHGTGVYGCHPKKNPMYSYRESLVLGVTALSDQSVKEVVTRLQREWPGAVYDLLTRNCCHFCEEFAQQLGVAKLPAWLNRFAYGADAVVTWTNGAMEQVRNLSATTSSWWRYYTGSAEEAEQAKHQYQQQQQQQHPNVQPRNGNIGVLLPTQTPVNR